MKSQNDMVLEHLQTHRGITAMDAYNIYGITRIGSRIYDLRQRGHKILSCDCEIENRFGKKTQFVEYRLVRDV